MACDFEFFVVAGDEDVVDVEDLGESLGGVAEGVGEAAGFGFASRASWAGCSMVAGSDSMWVRMVAMPGISARMLASRRVTRSWAVRRGRVSSTSRWSSRCSAPSYCWTETSWTERLARAATARTRSWTDSARVAVGTEWTTTSAWGRTRWMAAVAAMVICSERWKVRLRGMARVRSAK